MTLIFFVILNGILAQQCLNDISMISQRKDCGFYGITNTICLSRGCCWSPLQPGTNGPWCFSATNTPVSSCPLDLPGPNRIDCGFYGITQDQCLAKGCCWAPTTNGP